MNQTKDRQVGGFMRQTRTHTHTHRYSSVINVISDFEVTEWGGGQPVVLTTNFVMITTIYSTKNVDNRYCSVDESHLVSFRGCFIVFVCVFFI